MFSSLKKKSSTPIINNPSSPLFNVIFYFHSALGENYALIRIFTKVSFMLKKKSIFLYFGRFIISGNVIDLKEISHANIAVGHIKSY